MKQLLTSLVLSRLDYCNSVFVALPASTSARLQDAACAERGCTAARLLLRLSPGAHQACHTYIACIGCTSWIQDRHPDRDAHHPSPTVSIVSSDIIHTVQRIRSTPSPFLHDQSSADVFETRTQSGKRLTWIFILFRLFAKFSKHIYLFSATNVDTVMHWGSYVV